MFSFFWGGGGGFYSLAIGKEGELTIGTIDDIQKLHIRTVPLGEHPRRIAHQESSHTFAICSAKYSPTGSNGEDMENHFVRLIEDQTFEINSSFALDPYENGCSIITCSFSDDPNVYYCVGTAYALPEESEPSKVSKLLCDIWVLVWAFEPLRVKVLDLCVSKKVCIY